MDTCTLSSYIAKRAFDLRFLYWEENGAEHATCDFCAKGDIPPSLRLSFESLSCPHIICEPCLWRSTLERLEKTRGDAVACPCCFPPEHQESNLPVEPTESRLRRERYEATRRAFYDLPRDSNDLKATNGKARKKVKNGRFILSSTWSHAVVPQLGSSQETRMDRFFSFVESGSLHHVRGCLQEGIDLDVQNQYGQTGLYIAAWRGHKEIVRQLLECGSNPNALANGGTSPADAAAVNGFDQVVDVLQLYGGAKLQRLLDRLSLSRQEIVLDEIVPLSLQHPGAGSHTIDGVLDENAAQRLIQLRGKLPVAEGKNKAGPCSERRYYCDISRYVTTLLDSTVQAINDQIGGVVFLPFTRFLCYSERDTILAPHVDLTRMDVDSGKQSTHTFILYLTDCHEGGATSLLGSLHGPGRHEKLAVVRPRRGRLLLFPHRCPHEGEAVVDVPKLLIRGEAILPEQGLWQS